MLDMDPAIRARWAAALRSGDYDQGRRNLRRDDKYCCLGVLCDLAARDGITSGEAASDGTWYYDGADGVLPDTVVAWAGLEAASPAVPFPVPGHPGSHRLYMLTELNDGEADGDAAHADRAWTLAEIAGLIDGDTSDPA